MGVVWSIAGPEVDRVVVAMVMGLGVAVPMVVGLGRSCRIEVEGAVCVDRVGGDRSSAVKLTWLVSALVGIGGVCDAEMNPSVEGSAEAVCVCMCM